jgi:hypothetical protein
VYSQECGKANANQYVAPERFDVTGYVIWFGDMLSWKLRVQLTSAVNYLLSDRLYYSAFLI